MTHKSEYGVNEVPSIQFEQYANKDGGAVRCRICNQVSVRDMYNLKRHIQSRHGDVFNEVAKNYNTSTIKKTTPINKLLGIQLNKDRKVTAFVFGDNLPSSILDSPHLKNLIEYCRKNPMYKIPGRDVFERTITPKTVQDTQKKIKDLLTVSVLH